jgi:hypothetical protein
LGVVVCPVVSRFARDHRLPYVSPSGDGVALIRMRREQRWKTKTPPKIGGVSN